MGDKMLLKWTAIDMNALSELSKLIISPGIHQIGTTALPAPIQQMPGAVSYFVSAYSAPTPIGSNTLVGGELLVIRSDESKMKVLTPMRF